MWSVEECTAGAGELHGRAWPEPLVRTVRVHHVVRPALVLGSTQASGTVDLEAAGRAGVEVARRRSGGAAVLLTPGRDVWIDLFLPAADPLWQPDVARAAEWVGHAWATALGRLGVASAVHVGPSTKSRWSPLVCFAGLGPGEVTVAGPGSGPGPKLVGLSARRARSGVRYQSLVPGSWSPGDLLGLLRMDPGERGQAEAELASVAVGAGSGLGLAPAELVAALLGALPA